MMEYFAFLRRNGIKFVIHLITGATFSVDEVVYVAKDFVKLRHTDLIFTIPYSSILSVDELVISK